MTRLGIRKAYHELLQSKTLTNNFRQTYIVGGHRANIVIAWRSCDDDQPIDLLVNLRQELRALTRNTLQIMASTKPINSPVVASTYPLWNLICHPVYSCSRDCMIFSYYCQRAVTIVHTEHSVLLPTHMNPINESQTCIFAATASHHSLKRAIMDTLQQLGVARCENRCSKSIGLFTATTLLFACSFQC